MAVKYLNLLTGLVTTPADIHLCSFCLCEDLFMLSLQSISITQSTKCTQRAHNLFKGGQGCMLEITAADVNNELQMLTTLFLFPFLFFFPLYLSVACKFILALSRCWLRFRMTVCFPPPSIYLRFYNDLQMTLIISQLLLCYFLK